MNSRCDAFPPTIPCKPNKNRDYNSTCNKKIKQTKQIRYFPAGPISILTPLHLSFPVSFSISPKRKENRDEKKHSVKRYFQYHISKVR